MTAPGDDDPREQESSSGGSAAILRAIGSLLVALSGGEEQVRERTRHLPSDPPQPRTSIGQVGGDTEPARSGSGEMNVNDPTHGQQSPPAGDEGGESDEVAWLLADARERAQQILDESMEKAEELLRQRSGGVSERVLAEIQQTVGDLVDGMTEVRGRLARIETLLQQRTAREERAPQRRAASGPPPRPDRVPFSVVPPEAPASATPPPARPPESAGASAPPPASATPPRREPEPASEAGGLDDRMFDPARGAVLLRVSPVAGFQGLMRVQDALGRVEAVRQATVEAYAQGEARLRLELAAAVEATEIAAGLELGVGETAEVRAASTADRTLVIVLG